MYTRDVNLRRNWRGRLEYVRSDDPLRIARGTGLCVTVFSGVTRLLMKPKIGWPRLSSSGYGFGHRRGEDRPYPIRIPAPATKQGG